MDFSAGVHDVICTRKNNIDLGRRIKNLASHTFVFVNARFCLHIQKRWFVYEKVPI